VILFFFLATLVFLLSIFVACRRAAEEARLARCECLAHHPTALHGNGGGMTGAGISVENGVVLPFRSPVTA
jgi:hypothetical protein